MSQGLFTYFLEILCSKHSKLSIYQNDVNNVHIALHCTVTIYNKWFIKCFKIFTIVENNICTYMYQYCLKVIVFE